MPRPMIFRALCGAALAATLVLAGCARHVASDAPVTFAPSDTPFLFANFKPLPDKLARAWMPDDTGSTFDAAGQAQLAELVRLVRERDPRLADVLNAFRSELAGVRTRAQLEQATGLAWPALYALYGIGDVPVLRVELASPDAFRSFLDRVERHAGLHAPTATLDGQRYRSLATPGSRLQLLAAIEDRQLVLAPAPVGARPDLLRELLGLRKPARNAVDRLADVNAAHGYNDYGSGFIDLPRLAANLFGGKDAATREFVAALGLSAPDDPACAPEADALARQVPQVTTGSQSQTTGEARGSIDISLSPALHGILAAFAQPVAGMAATRDDSLLDLVVALPVAPWRAFVRKHLASRPTHACPALQPLDRLAAIAVNPPLQFPPELDSLLGVRVVVDRWDAGPRIAGRILAASSDSATLARKIAVALPQFAMRSIPTDGTPVAFDLPGRLQAMLGSGPQGWFAADGHSVVLGIGEGEDARLAAALKAPSGSGGQLLRFHMDGRMYGALADWLEQLRASMRVPTHNAPGTLQPLRDMARLLAAEDITVKLDDEGLHMQVLATHR